ncbi:hypothetical protein Tco_1008891 [Tanacetum coccineum]
MVGWMKIQGGAGCEASHLDVQNPRCCLEGWKNLDFYDLVEVARNVKKNGVEDDYYMVEVVRGKSDQVVVGQSSGCVMVFQISNGDGYGGRMVMMARQQWAVYGPDQPTHTIMGLVADNGPPAYASRSQPLGLTGRGYRHAVRSRGSFKQVHLIQERDAKGNDDAPRVNILDFCQEHYEDILPVIMDKIRRDKRKEVHARLYFGDNTKISQRMREGSQNSSAGTLSARYRNPLERPKVRNRLKDNDGNVFGRLCHRRQSAFDRLSDTYSLSTTKSGPDRASSRDHSHSRGHPHRWDSSLSRDHPRSIDHSCSIKESYDNTCSSYMTGASHGYHCSTPIFTYSSGS